MSNVDVWVGCHPFWIWEVLMIVERTVAGVISSNIKEMIAKMSEDLAKVVEDFLRVVDVETLFLTQRPGKYRSSQPGHSQFSMVSVHSRSCVSTGPTVPTPAGTRT